MNAECSGTNSWVEAPLNIFQGAVYGQGYCNNGNLILPGISPQGDWPNTCTNASTTVNGGMATLTAICRDTNGNTIATSISYLYSISPLINNGNGKLGVGHVGQETDDWITTPEAILNTIGSVSGNPARIDDVG